MERLHFVPVFPLLACDASIAASYIDVHHVVSGSTPGQCIAMAGARMSCALVLFLHE